MCAVNKQSIMFAKNLDVEPPQVVQKAISWLFGEEYTPEPKKEERQAQTA